MVDGPARITPLWRSAALRTVGISGLLFLLSAAVVFLLLYRTVIGTVEDQLLRLAETQAHALARGVDPEEPAPPEGGWTVAHAPGRYRVVITSAGHVLLNELPLRERIIGPIIASPAELKSILVHEQQLDDSGIVGFGLTGPAGSYVFVGHKDDQVSEIRESMLRILGAGTATVIALYMIVGLFMGRRAFARIARMNAVAAAAMAGDLSRRMPVSAGNDEVDDLARQLNRMFAALERSVAALRQVSTDIAHDMRTPLTRLRQRLDELRAETSPAGRQALVQRASDEVDKALEIFAAMLRIAQIESGVARSQFASVDLSGLLRELCDIYEPVFRDSGRELRARIADGVQLAGDRALLQQLFANLLDNSIVHTPAGTVANLELKKLHPGWIARLQDTGPGIDRDSRNSVFDRFVRGDASRTTPGSGLGLALARAIAETHDLVLAIEDGTGFSIVVEPVDNASQP